MDLQKFLEFVPQEILERGKKIQERDEIIEITRRGEEIEALVKGNYYPWYKVTIKIKGQEIEDWECSCLYKGEVCKHIAAVILKIFNPEKSQKEKKKRRKSKMELVEEILEQVSFQELKELIKELIPHDLKLRNALLSRFASYAQLETRTLDAKYNTLFRHLLNSYRREGFLDYYATMNFGQEVENLLLSAEKLLEQGNIEEALVIAKTVLRNWMKNLENMDDSSGTTSIIIGGVLQIFVRLYHSGKKEILDFLLKEGEKELYKRYGIEYDFAKALIEIAESPDEARKVLKFLEKLPYSGLEKAQILLKWFPQEYKKFVREAASNFEVAEFHLKRLLNRKDYEEALEYVELVLSCSEFRRKEDFQAYKALILEKLGRRKEALEVYYQLFTKTLFLDFLWEVKKLALEEEWRKIKIEAKKLLKGFGLLDFLLSEGDYQDVVEALEKMKKEVTLHIQNFKKAVVMIKKLPDDLRQKAGEILLDWSFSLLEGKTSRKFYREFLSALTPFWKLVGRERMEEFFQELLRQYPTRKALKEEIEAFIS